MVTDQQSYAVVDLRRWSTLTWLGVGASIKGRLKQLRNSQPFNWIATTLLRPIVRIAGAEEGVIPLHLHRCGTVRAPLPNGRTLRLWSRGDDFVSNQIFWKGWDAYESETLKLFFQLAAKAEVIVDIGAHVGVFTLVAAHANPSSQVYAFEPVPATYGRLENNVRLNNLKNVRCFQSAVSDIVGTTEVFHQPGMTFTASLSREFMNWQPAWSASVVPVTTGDQFVRENGVKRVDLMKIDTESTEPQVLAGMIETIRRDHPDIICEVLPDLTEQRVQDLLTPLGYNFFRITDRGLLKEARISGDLKFRNYLLSTAPDKNRIFQPRD